MRVRVAVKVGLVLAVAAVIVGFSLSGLGDVARYCSGDVIDPTLCQGAKLPVAIFGSVLAGAGVVGAAIIVGAGLIASPRSSPDESSGAADAGASTSDEAPTV